MPIIAVSRSSSSSSTPVTRGSVGNCMVAPSVLSATGPECPEVGVNCTHCPPGRVNVPFPKSTACRKSRPRMQAPVVMMHERLWHAYPLLHGPPANSLHRGKLGHRVRRCPGCSHPQQFCEWHHGHVWRSLLQGSCFDHLLLSSRSPVHPPGTNRALTVGDPSISPTSLLAPLSTQPTPGLQSAW